MSQVIRFETRTESCKIQSFTVSFSIGTSHGTDLERVLADAGERKGGDRWHYFTLLCDAVDETVQEFSGAEVSDVVFFDDCLITLEFDMTHLLDIEDINRVLDAVAETVEKWKIKYRIESMK